jgi:hypothetical protein
MREGFGGAGSEKVSNLRCLAAVLGTAGPDRLLPPLMSTSKALGGRGALAVLLTAAKGNWGAAGRATFQNFQVATFKLQLCEATSPQGDAPDALQTPLATLLATEWRQNGYT